jgi:hypothetical protein
MLTTKSIYLKLAKIPIKPPIITIESLHSAIFGRCVCGTEAELLHTIVKMVAVQLLEYSADPWPEFKAVDF